MPYDLTVLFQNVCIDISLKSFEVAIKFLCDVPEPLSRLTATIFLKSESRGHVNNYAYS